MTLLFECLKCETTVEIEQGTVLAGGRCAGTRVPHVWVYVSAQVQEPEPAA